MAKAYDLLDLSEKAFHESTSALRTMDKLVALRKDQASSEKVRNVNYESLLAPFYFRTGDFLATYIMLNTDELGTVRPFQEEPMSDGEEEASAEPEAKPGQEEEKKEEEVPATTSMINTSAPAQTNDENEVAKEGAAAPNGGDENYEQEALNYLSLGLQIIGDFNSSGDVAERRKLTVFLEIDTLMSRVQLFCHAPDYQSALDDLKVVEGLCTEFPEKNESTLNSALFQMGKCEMDLNNFEAALAHFNRTQEM